MKGSAISSEKRAELTVKPVEFDEELRLANQLMAKTHKPDDHSCLWWFETSGAGYPGFRREHTRIALWNNELAGALRLTTDTIRIGEARLKMGGFGWVSTESRHRKKGICSALMWDTIEYMRDHRYHVSMLFGIPNFYHRFGYATVLADYSVVVNALDTDMTKESNCVVRPVKPGDISAIQKIHENNDVDVAGSLLRNRAHITNKWEQFKKARVLTTGQGKVVGYVLARINDKGLVVDEVGMESMDLAQEILGLCGEWADESFAGQIRFLTPPDHPFAHYLLQYASVHETHVSREAGGMMAFMDLAEALENMIPEWESLLSHSILKEHRCEVTLVVDSACYRIRANKGAVDVAALAGKNKFSVSSVELIQLLMGYRYIHDVISGERRLLRPDARELLAVLFPKRNPYVWSFDRF